MIDQCTTQALSNSDTVKVGDLIKITPMAGTKNRNEDYYLIVDITYADNKSNWRALHNGKLVTFSGMTSTSGDIVISRPGQADD